MFIDGVKHSAKYIACSLLIRNMNAFLANDERITYFLISQSGVKQRAGPIH